MSSGFYYSSSNTHSDRGREFNRTHSSFSADSTPYSIPASSSTQRATPSYPSNNDHAFMAFHVNAQGLTPIGPISHTPQGILHAPSQPDPSKKHQCPNCYKSFDRPSGLETHMVTHNNNSPLFLCTVCHKPFNVKSNRNRHMRDQHGIHDIDNATTSRASSRYPSSGSSGASPNSFYSSF